MAISIIGKNAPLQKTGITAGNEFIWKVDAGQVATIQGLMTSAGEAIIKYSLEVDEPTDFTNFVDSEVGSHTATFGETSGVGVRWIGIDVTSGTWTAIISKIKTV